MLRRRDEPASSHREHTNAADTCDVHLDDAAHDELHRRLHERDDLITDRQRLDRPRARGRPHARSAHEARITAERGAEDEARSDPEPQAVVRHAPPEADDPTRSAPDLAHAWRLAPR